MVFLTDFLDWQTQPKKNKGREIEKKKKKTTERNFDKLLKDHLKNENILVLMNEGNYSLES